MSKQSGGPAVASWVAIAAIGGAALITACSSTTSPSNSNASPSSVSISVSVPPTTSHPTTSQPATSPATGKSSSSATVSAATCKHVNSLRGSLTSLTHVRLSAGSSGEITHDLRNIQTQLVALKGQGSAAFTSHANQLNASLNQVKKAAHGLGTSPSPTQVGTIITALSGLKAQSKSTMSELNNLCPSK